MARKRLADLLQEEARNLTPDEAEVSSPETMEETATEDISTATTTPLLDSHQFELEATVKELQQELEQVITQAKQKEEILQQEIRNLQAALAVEKTSAERKQAELDEAKQVVLQLAESNSQLIEEINGLKQPREKSHYIVHKKSHRLPEKLTTQPNESDDFASNTWLYD